MPQLDFSLFIDATDALNGIDLFNKVVLVLTRHYKMDFAFVGDLVSHKGKVQTLAFAKNRALGINFSYDLALTPCDEVLDRTYCHFGSGVAKSFPKDQMLKDMGIEGYVGYPLISSTGESIGILVCLHKTPIESSGEVFELLRFIARRVESELERLHLLKALDESEKKKEKAENIRSQVLKNVSHELMTPLNAILGFSSILKNKHLQGLAPAQMEEYLSVIHQSGEELLRSISQLIELSQLQCGSYQYAPEEMEVLGLVKTSLHSTAQHYPHQKYLLDEGSLAFKTNIDPKLFIHTIIQLTENAAKHSLPGTQIHIEAGEVEDGFFISISDQGPGIPQAKLEEVVRAFGMGDEVETKATGGLGLGLAYVKESTTLMGAEFTLESEHQKGTRATIRFQRGTDEIRFVN